MSSPKHISTPDPQRQERGAVGRIGQLLSQGRQAMESGALQQGMLAPYLYDLAGMDVDYEDRTGRFQELSSTYDDALKQLTDVRRIQAEGTGGATAKRTALKNLTQSLFPEQQAALQNKKGNIKGGKLKKYLRGQIEAIGREAGDIAATPYRIKGMKEKEGAKATREREAQIQKQSQEMLLKSMSMNPEDVLAADPALARQLKEEQAQLENAQVRQFGSLADAQGGTIGSIQNAAMGQRRAEAISNARRENIGLYQGLQSQQSQNNLASAGARGGLAGIPGAQQQATGMNFGQLAGGYNPLLQWHQGNRQMQFQANSFNQSQPSILEGVLGGIGGMLNPLKGMGGKS